MLEEKHEKEHMPTNGEVGLFDRGVFGGVTDARGTARLAKPETSSPAETRRIVPCPEHADVRPELSAELGRGFLPGAGRSKHLR